MAGIPDLPDFGGGSRSPPEPLGIEQMLGDWAEHFELVEKWVLLQREVQKKQSEVEEQKAWVKKPQEVYIPGSTVIEGIVETLMYMHEQLIPREACEQCAEAMENARKDPCGVVAILSLLRSLKKGNLHILGDEERKKKRSRTE